MAADRDHTKFEQRHREHAVVQADNALGSDGNINDATGIIGKAARFLGEHRRQR